MTNATTDATATPSKPTPPHPGGPPRWLVVMMMLAIGYGFWSQRPARKEPHYIAPQLEGARLSRTTVLRQGPGQKSSTFQTGSLAADPDSDQFWVLTSARAHSGGSLMLSASAPGKPGSWQMPVDLAAILPPLSQLRGELVRSDSGTLYVVASGLAPKRGIQFSAILRSIDDGVSWQIWQQLPEEYSMLNSLSTRCVIWNEQLALIGYCTLESGEIELWAYLIDESDGEVHPVRLASMPGGRTDFVLDSVLPTSQQLHVSAKLIKTGQPSRVFIASLETDGENITQTELALESDEYPRTISLVEPHPGEVLAVVALYMSKENFQTSPRTLKAQLTGEPMRWTLEEHPASRLWQWSLDSGTWVRLTDPMHGPRFFGTPIPYGQSTLIEYCRDPQTDVPKFRFHQLSTDAPGWLSFCEVEGPASARAQVWGSATLDNGEVLLLVDEDTGAQNHPLMLWRIALPESMSAAPGSPMGSP